MLHRFAIFLSLEVRAYGVYAQVVHVSEFEFAALTRSISDTKTTTVHHFGSLFKMLKFAAMHLEMTNKT